MSSARQEVDISLSKWDNLRQQHLHLRLVVQLRVPGNAAVLCKVGLGSKSYQVEKISNVTTFIIHKSFVKTRPELLVQSLIK